MPKASTLAVLVAAGRSARMGGGERKPFLDLAGTPVLARAARALAAAPGVTWIVAVVAEEDEARARATLRGVAKLAAVLPGGAERVDSVRAGVRWSGAEPELVLVHDGARPLVTVAVIEAVLAGASTHGAALAAVALADTLKRSRDGRMAEETLAREGLWRAQTPQAFEARRFRACLERAEREGLRPTDDAALWERYVGPVALVPDLPTNLKITTPADLELARALVAARPDLP
ncbi:MAG TPA: 2-C-methyl-D-erythritol 4-phosphate cytidylyltransferase [Planctomycetota bacterium]